MRDEERLDSPIRGRPTKAVVLGALALLVTGSAFARQQLATPEASHPPSPPHEVQRDVPRVTSGTIRYSPEYAARIGLTTEVAQDRSIAPVTEVTGEVDLSPAHVAAVGARIFGRVTSVLVTPGDAVHEGQALARLESADLGRAQARLLSARAQETFAESDHHRKHLLVDEGLAAHRSIEVAQNQLTAAEAERRAAEQTVRAMGGSSRSSARLGRFVLRSPIDGDVIDVSVSRGQAIEPSHTAFRIADLDHLWLELAVFESDLDNVAVGDDVVVRPSGDASTRVQGVVEHVGAVIDPSTRAATVRISIDDPSRQLRVGQAVAAQIVSRGSAVTGLSVPHGAVVLVDGRPTVFVVPADGEAVPRAVTLGVRGTDHVQIVEGLGAGERVAVGGVFALKSELFR